MPCSTNFPFSNKQADINGWQVQFTDQALLNLYADRAGATGAATGGGKLPDSVREVVIASLATNRITYCKSRQGDCGTPTSGGPPAAGKAIQYGGAALGTTTSLAATGALGGTLAASTAVLGAATAGIGLLALPLLGIFAHHAQAVATEQQTLCAVADAWNSFAINMEAQLKQGKVSQQDAQAALQQVHDNLAQTLSGIEKPVNAAVHYHKALDALLLFNKEVVIPSRASFLSGTLGKAVVAGAIIGGAKLAGAF
jgi:hypothetical protein